MLDIIIALVLLIIFIRIYFKILYYGQDGNELKASLFFTIISVALNFESIFSMSIITIIVEILGLFAINFISFKVCNLLKVRNKFLYFLLFNVAEILLAIMMIGALYLFSILFV